jgi:hypothetical protein
MEASDLGRGGGPDATREVLSDVDARAREFQSGMHCILGLDLFVCAVALKRRNANRHNYSLSKHARLSATVFERYQI